MIGRRDFITGSASILVLASCMPAAGSVTIAASAAAGANPGPDGAERPLTLQVVQMKGTGAFDGADFFALQSPQAALGGDFVKADQIVLAPGGSATKTIALDPGTTAIGIVGGFRSPAGKVFRVKSAVSAKANVSFAIGAGAGGLSLKPA
jgi:type VI secretion system protein VasD